MYLWTYHIYLVLRRYYYFNHISPLHRYYYTWNHFYLLHIPLIHRYTISLDTVISYICNIITWIFRTQLYHVRTSLLYVFTGIVHLLFLYSCHVDRLSYYMDYCYIYITLFPLHDCFPLLILIFSLLDMWVVDMECVKLSVMWVQAMGVTSRISHFLFSVSRYLVSCY